MSAAVTSTRMGCDRSCDAIIATHALGASATPSSASASGWPWRLSAASSRTLVGASPCASKTQPLRSITPQTRTRPSEFAESWSSSSRPIAPAPSSTTSATSCRAAVVITRRSAIGRAAVTRSSDRVRSATRSDADSMPIDRRSSPSVMPAFARAAASMETCVIVAGCAMRLSTPPSDSASVKYWSDPASCSAPSAPAASSKLTIAPNPRCCRAAISWPA